ncbi:hypothetical protein [Streptomyces misionensis]
MGNQQSGPAVGRRLFGLRGITLEKGVFRLGAKGGGRFVQIPLKRPVPHEHAAERSFPPLAAGEFRPVRLAPAKPG